MHLKTIPYLRRRYRCEVGLSDHSLDPAVTVAAVAPGAVSLLGKRVCRDVPRGTPVTWDRFG